jgi:hypothetical protein
LGAADDDHWLPLLRVPDPADPVKFTYNVEQEEHTVSVAVSLSRDGRAKVEAPVWQLIMDSYLVREEYIESLGFAARMVDLAERTAAVEMAVAAIATKPLPFAEEFNSDPPWSGLEPAPAVDPGFIGLL